MSLALDILTAVLLAAGGVLTAAGGLGLLRLPNLFTRLHAVGLVDTGGAVLLLAGMALQAGWSLVTVKLVLIGIFLFFTSPTSSHALTHAAILCGLSPDETRDGLHDDEDEGPGAERPGAAGGRR